MKEALTYRTISIDGVQMEVPIKREGRYLYADPFKANILVGFVNEKRQEEYLPNVEELFSV